VSRPLTSASAADRVVATRSLVAMIAHCGTSTRLPDARPRAELGVLCASQIRIRSARPPGALGHGVELADDEGAAAIGLDDLDLEAVIWSDRGTGGGRA
jgi:hypothetical protein